MTLRNIYDVCLRRCEKEIDERTFLSCLGLVLGELRIEVPQKYLWLSDTLPPPERVTPDELWINDIFHVCVPDGILFYVTGDEKYEAEFLRKCSQAVERAREEAAANRQIRIRKYGW